MPTTLSTCAAIIIAAAIAQSESASTENTAPTLPTTLPSQIVADEGSPPAVVHHPNDGSRSAPAGLLTPIPESGNLPAIVGMLNSPTEDELRFRAAARKYGQQIRKIKHQFFGNIKVPAIRAEGISQISEFTDPASFRPLLEDLADQKDDVRLAVLNHLEKQGVPGQAALGWASIYDRNRAIRHEALKRMTRPVSPSVLLILDSGLRSRVDSVANNAAALAGALNVLEAIPLLIFAQTVATPTENTGDLAWIAIETQRSYVAGLQPVAGDASGAFQPIIGVVSDGSVLRVVDAVVIAYRTEVHHVLVSLTTSDWGQSTEVLGYDLDAWWHWYNEQYVPFRIDRLRQAELAGGVPNTGRVDPRQ